MQKIFSACIILLVALTGCKSDENKALPTDTAKTETGAYVPASSALFDEIYTQDSLMFAAFNAHDSAGLMAFFSDSLEFYHDKGGLADFAGTASGFQLLFERNKDTGLRRKLVAGTMEVYPVPDYGAIEVCRHEFCHTEAGKEDCGIFKNIMIWKKTGNAWKVTRVISYDHK
ncbi:MAG: nuclear transport factor 2 family protein [Bacteroidetes bacterium]|nr:nuclear transport factor 2 family protein [Bacteroidota bacterium]